MWARRISHRMWIALGLTVLAVLGLLATSGCTAFDTQVRSGAGSLGGSEIGIADGLTIDNPLDLSAPATISLDGIEFVPKEIAPTFTEKRFWIVLGLVVLGWIVLAADYTNE